MFSVEQSGDTKRTIVVSGHLCLDLTPSLSSSLPAGGGLIHSQGLAATTGGSVPNVGLALMKLGSDVRMVGLLGNDMLAPILKKLLRDTKKQSSLRTIAEATTSFSIVLVPPAADRSFIHYRGANDFFTSDSVRPSDLRDAIWLHFGYRRRKVKRVLVAAVNDTSALAALQSFRESGLENECAIVGHDAGIEARQELRRSSTRLIGSVALFPENYGRELIKLALDILEKKHVPPAVFTQHVLVTSQNVNKIYPNDSWMY